MDILIIGGTGNISRWLVQILADRGDTCTLYNRGRRKIGFHGKVREIHGDRTKPQQFIADMLSLPCFDCVIDMVAYEPPEAEAAAKAFLGRTGQYIFCSTVDVYRKPQPVYPVPFTGATGPSPLFRYARNKWEMECRLQEFAARSGFPLTIIRPGATYSEGWSPLITSFGGDPVWLGRLCRGEKIILHGDGSVLWSMTHSEDVSRAFAAAAGNPAALGQSYNVTGDEWLTWETMHRVVAGLLGAPEPRFEYIPANMLARMAPDHAGWCLLNFQYNNIFENQKAKEELGFTYTIAYSTGALRCLNALEIADTPVPAFYEEILGTWETLTRRMTIDNECRSPI